MERFCKSECPDRGSEGCQLPSLREQAAAHGRVALRMALELGARLGRSKEDERYKTDWQLKQAVEGVEAMNQRVTDCIQQHQFGEEATVLYLRTE